MTTIHVAAAAALPRALSCLSPAYASVAGMKIAFEGLVGVGKSSIVNAFEQSLCVAGVAVRKMPEPVTLDTINWYLTDPTARAADFEQGILDKRLQWERWLCGQSDTGEAPPSKETTVILDRSFIGDHAFFIKDVREALITDRAKIRHYEDTLYDALTTQPSIMPDLVVHLDASASTVMRRIEERGIAREVDAYVRRDPGYTTRLGDAYAEVLDFYCPRNATTGRSTALSSAAGKCDGVSPFFVCRTHVPRLTVDWEAPPPLDALAPLFDNDGTAMVNPYMDALVHAIHAGATAWSPSSVARQ